MPSAQQMFNASPLALNCSSSLLFLIPCTESTRSTYSGARSGPIAGTFVDVAPLGAHCVKLAAQFWRASSLGEDAEAGESRDAKKTDQKSDEGVKGISSRSYEERV